MPSFADLTPDNFDFFARYVLAGFLIFLIRNAYVFGERPKLAEIALDILLFSLVNQLVWRLLAFIGMLTLPLLPPTSWLPPGTEVLFYIEIMALPLLIGVASGRALRAGWARSLLRLVSMPIIDPIPRAYDHVFAMRGPGFVIVSFQDGKSIYGYYGQESRAGRDPGRSEIYLQRLYVIDGDGNWIETVPRRAALISLAGLRSIEFLD